MKKLFILFVVLFVLAGCQNVEWEKPVNLTIAEEAKYKKIIKEQQDVIKNYTPKSEDEIDDDKKDKNPSVAPIADWIDLARAQEAVGYLADAMETYKEAKTHYKRSEAVENNIAKLYEKAGDKKAAIKQYWYLIETFLNPQYYYDLSRLYIEAENIQKAEETYQIYLRDYNKMKPDPQIEGLIQKLKESS